MKSYLLIFITAINLQLFGQSKNFIDQPYIELTTEVDTLVVPDRIYLSILITEGDSKNKESVEAIESKMFAKLRELGVDIKKQLSFTDLSSEYKKYFLKPKDILKSKAFELIL